jgi:pimeloyl-ACP methyl ester carboxylesterase
MVRVVTWILLIVVGFYIVVAASLFMYQRKLLYHPDPAHYTPEQAGLERVNEVKLTTPDGVHLVAWEAKPDSGKPTILYFHGNSGALKSRTERVRRFVRQGLGVFITAYRGFGGSEGSPTEADIIADAQLAYDHLVKNGTDPKRIVVYGESLGTGVAVQLAASRPVAGVVLDAPYSAIADIGQQRYPFIPVRLFLIDQYDSVEHIKSVRAPILIMHGNLDRTVPLVLGQRLFAAAPEPKQMQVFDGAGHSDIYNFGALQVLNDFLDRTVLQPAAAR